MDSRRGAENKGYAEGRAPSDIPVLIRVLDTGGICCSYEKAKSRIEPGATAGEDVSGLATRSEQSHIHRRRNLLLKST